MGLEYLPTFFHGFTYMIPDVGTDSHEAYGEQITKLKLAGSFAKGRNETRKETAWCLGL